MSEQKPLRLLFFSDWRIQPLQLIENILDSVGNIDLIVYGGDDLHRFFTLEIAEDVVKSLKKVRKYKKDAFLIENYKEVIQLGSKLLGRTPLSYDDSSDRWTLHRILRLFITIDDENYFTRIAKRTKYGVVAIHGNDSFSEWQPLLSVSGIRNIHMSPIVLNGWGFVGIQGAIVENHAQTNSEFSPVSYHLDSNVIQHIESLQLTIDIQPEHTIIVSHTPPLGCHDVAIRYGFERIGSPSLRKYIEQQKPSAVLCGYVHSGGGKSLFLGDTLVANGASDDTDIKRTNAAIVDLIPGKRPHIQWIDPRPHHVLFAPSIGKTRTEILAKFCIHRIEELAKADNTVFKSINFGKIRKARLKALQQAFIENKPVWVGDKQDNFPKKLIFYDVETGFAGDPTNPQDPWMIGILVEDESSPIQWCIPEADRNARQKMFQEFIKILKQHPEAVLCSWSGNWFDDRMIEAGLSRWHKQEVSYWQKRPQIDLRNELKASLVFPTYDLSIKNVARCCGFKENRDSSDMNGFDVGLAYELFKKCAEPLDLEKFLEYNADDVLRLNYMAKWYRMQTPYPTKTGATV